MDDDTTPDPAGKLNGFFVVPRSALLALRNADSSSIRLYLELCNFANRRRECWPSASTLAARLGVNRTTIFRALKWLEDAGLIQRWQGRARHGNIYRLTSGTHATITGGSANSGTDATSGTHATITSGTDATSLVAPTPPKVDKENKNQLNKNQEGESAAPTPPPAAEVRQVFDSWNAMASAAGVPTARDLTDKRRNTIKLRLANLAWRNSWRAALDLIPATPFLLGENDRGWRIDLGFFLRPDSVTTILEGKYADSPRKMNGRRDAACGPGQIHPEDAKRCAQKGVM